jgi:LPS sulfotransferase NodH
MPRRPHEYFEGAVDPEIFEILGPRTQAEQDEARYDPSRSHRYEDYLKWALEAGTTPNGVFASKVMWGYFNGFVTGLRWAVPGRQRLPVAELAPSVFPNLHYLWVTRRDRVRQAVSLWRAIQSWSWSSDQNPDAHVGEHLRFSAAAIRHLVSDIDDHEREWQTFFDEAGVKPMIVVYEDFASQYEETVREILRYIGVQDWAEIDVPTPKRRRQSDGISEEWATRFLEGASQQRSVSGDAVGAV